MSEIKSKDVYRPVQIFESHSKLDKTTCDQFDIAAARVGIKVFRSEYENIERCVQYMEVPAWETIRTEMQHSRALFLLVGPKLVKAQAERKEDWKFTQNWIAYEVGLACALGIDVWILCNNVEINFPVPYLNNYSVGKIEIKAGDFEPLILESYLEGRTYPYGFGNSRFSCPWKGCRAKFNFHNVMKENSFIRCPTCLRKIEFPKGYP